MNKIVFSQIAQHNRRLSTLGDALTETSFSASASDESHSCEITLYRPARVFVNVP